MHNVPSKSISFDRNKEAVLFYERCRFYLKSKHTNTNRKKQSFGAAFCYAEKEKTNMTQHRLVIAEKPSVAQSIAAVLGATKRNDGYLSGNGYLVSWCFGHLAELAGADVYDEKYAKWRYDDLPILPEHWQMVTQGARGSLSSAPSTTWQAAQRP